MPAPTSELNTTPLIDVLLVLLIFLILTLPIMTHETRLVLPHGIADKPAPKVIQLDIDAEGRTYWNGVAAQDLAQLEIWFRRTARTEPESLIRITPERIGRYEPVAQVLAAAQRQHMSNLRIDPVPP